MKDASNLVHATARLCQANVAQALAHLSTQAGMSRWVLGLWNCRELAPGLFQGESLFDGGTGFVRVRVRLGVELTDGTVDYGVGAQPDTLSWRIRASVVAGDALGHAPGSCLVTLQARRTGNMDDERWARLVHSHETEIELIRAQLATAAPP